MVAADGSGPSVREQLKAILKKNLMRVIDLFRDWDEDQTGRIRVVELRRAIGALGYDVPDHELDGLFNEFDTDGVREIKYEELNQALRRNSVKVGALLQVGALGAIELRGQYRVPHLGAVEALKAARAAIGDPDPLAALRRHGVQPQPQQLPAHSEPAVSPRSFQRAALRAAQQLAESAAAVPLAPTSLTSRYRPKVGGASLSSRGSNRTASRPMSARSKDAWLLSQLLGANSEQSAAQDERAGTAPPRIRHLADVDDLDHFEGTSLPSSPGSATGAARHARAHEPKPPPSPQQRPVSAALRLAHNPMRVAPPGGPRSRPQSARSRIQSVTKRIDNSWPGGAMPSSPRRPLTVACAGAFPLSGARVGRPAPAVHY